MPGVSCRTHSPIRGQQAFVTRVASPRQADGHFIFEDGSLTMKAPIPAGSHSRYLANHRPGFLVVTRTPDLTVPRRSSAKTAASTRTQPERQPEPGRANPAGARPSTDLVHHLWKFRTQYRDGKDADKLLRAAPEAGHGFLRRQRGSRGERGAGGRADADHPFHAGRSLLGSVDARGLLAGREGRTCLPS